MMSGYLVGGIMLVWAALIALGLDPIASLIPFLLCEATTVIYYIWQIHKLGAHGRGGWRRRRKGR